MKVTHDSMADHKFSSSFPFPLWSLFPSSEVNKTSLYTQNSHTFALKSTLVSLFSKCKHPSCHPQHWQDRGFCSLSTDNTTRVLHSV